ncbi:MAG: hemolysin family protein [Gemmatimonadetes bacterium]|nr:hemolysin family protein [Gemmatimonadota bacterium]
MDPDIYLPLLFPVLALLATNAFFVTAESALLTAPRGRLEAGSRDPGRQRPGLIGVAHPDEVLLLAQIGRSVSTLGVGYGLAMLALASAGSSFAPAVFFLTLAFGAVVHSVLSSQVPKLVGINHPGGRIAEFVVAPLRILALVLRPVVWPLARAVSLIARAVGMSTPSLQPLLHTADEIRDMISQGHQQGVVEEDEREMLDGVFEFSETVAREVMTPRIDIIAVPVEVSFDALVDVVINEGHSRIPVYQGTIDTVIGVLLAKDLLPLLADPAGNPKESFDIRGLMREPYFVPDTKPVDDILAELRQQSVHLAIVLDEFGGTYGLLTMEDLLEEIVGEINDEYDVAEPEFAATPEGDVLIDGGAALSEVNERFELELPEEDFDTLGGYIFGMLGRVPVPGDEVGPLGNGRGIMLHVEEIEDRRITRVRLTRAVPAQSIVEGR